jgi:hypothetical protein
MKNKILIYIMTSRNNINRIENIMNTWGSDLDIVFYSDHEDPTKNIIKVSDRTDYASNEEKQVNALNFLKNLYDEDNIPVLDSYDWIFLIDDDTYVNFKNLQKNIENFDKKCVYGSIFDSEKDSDNPAYKNNVIPLDMKFPSGGAGYLISSETIKEFGEFENVGIGAGDLSVGFNLYRRKIEQINNQLFNSQPPRFFNHNKNQISNSISYHYIYTLEEIKELMEIS